MNITITSSVTETPFPVTCYNGLVVSPAAHMTLFDIRHTYDSV